MNISDTGSNAASTTAATTGGTIATYLKSSKSRFMSDGILYLKRQRDRFGITAKAEHAAQRRIIADIFNCSESSVKNWFNNAKTTSEQSADANNQVAAIPDTNSQAHRPVLQQPEHPQSHSAVNPQGTLDVGRASMALRKRSEAGYQIFKQEESHFFRNVGFPDNAVNLDRRRRARASMAIASKALSEKWRNLSSEERAVFEAKAKEVNANLLQGVDTLNSEAKLEMCNKVLVQVGKMFEVLEALGWSYIFVGINKETNATFKEVKGEPAMVADLEFTKDHLGLEDQLRASQLVTKSFPAIAKFQHPQFREENAALLFSISSAQRVRIGMSTFAMRQSCKNNHESCTICDPLAACVQKSRAAHKIGKDCIANSKFRT
ncbi:hypothetical protein BJ741DRAFT_662551 [Chytriomyces cf. hyalinus JEL632]|nr:hypothetical protein BJ741DRAFT_662551 [Chytriomyces cf. hyalinus JEL632]